MCGDTGKITWTAVLFRYTNWVPLNTKRNIQAAMFQQINRCTG